MRERGRVTASLPTMGLPAWSGTSCLWRRTYPTPIRVDNCFASPVSSRWKDSNLRPSAPKADALTKLRYTQMWPPASRRPRPHVCGHSPLPIRVPHFSGPVHKLEGSGFHTTVGLAGATRTRGRSRTHTLEFWRLSDNRCSRICAPPGGYISMIHTLAGLSTIILKKFLANLGLGGGQHVRPVLGHRQLPLKPQPFLRQLPHNHLHQLGLVCAVRHGLCVETTGAAGPAPIRYCLSYRRAHVASLPSGGPAPTPPICPETSTAPTHKARPPRGCRSGSP